MGDSDRIFLECNISIDYLNSEIKNTRLRKNVRLIFDRDEWGTIILKIISKSRVTSFKLEDNIVRLYTTFLPDGKSSIELRLPRVILFISESEKDKLDEFFKILKQIKDHPEEANELELWKEEGNTE